MKNFSPFRLAEHRFFKTITLNGTTLDIGGDQKGEYQELIQGNNTFITTNIPGGHSADLFFDANETFPIEDEAYDNIFCSNVIEHLHSPEKAIREMIRVVKKRGFIVVVIPFMYQIHGSPSDYADYVRLTPSYFEKKAEECGFTIVKAEPFAPGLFTCMFQMAGGAVYPTFLRSICMWVCEKMDALFNHVSGYRKLSSRIPIGLCYVWQKN